MENQPTQQPVPPKNEAPANNTQSTPKQGTAPSGGNKLLFLRNRKVMIIIGAVIIVLIALLLLSRSYGPLSDKSQIPGSGPDSDLNKAPGANFSAEKPDGAIAKVGDEYIFQEDLKIELANYSGPKDENTDKILLDKLVKDSIVLQAANKEKIASLSAEIYNHGNKNYGKRFQQLRDIEKGKTDKVDKISVALVSVWFYNMKPAKIGLEEGKQEAFRRISALHRRVVNKEITVEQAGNLIKNDPSYDNLDFGYTNNAFVEFTTNKGTRVTMDPGYDEVLWRTNPGEVTEVYLGKTTNEFTNELGEAFYVFGQVKGKVNSGNTQTFAQWIESQKPNYAVTYY